MAKSDNLTDFLTDVADAIRAKKGTTDLINPQNFSSEIASIEGGGGGDTPSTPTCTGHADAEGLRAIGWTDEDIAYYQENGVNWNEEDDEHHKVTDDNKALYGVLTASNIRSYSDRIVYLPKIDTSNVTSMSSMFNDCHALVAIPHLDTSNVTSMSNMFYSCYSLTSIPQLDTSNVTNMSYMFYNCRAFVTIPLLDTSNVTDMSYMFHYCFSLVAIPQISTSAVTNMKNMFYSCYSLNTIPLLDTSNVTNMSEMFNYCYSLASIPQLDTSKVTNMSNMFRYCSAISAISSLDTSGVTNMSNMFGNCSALAHVNLRGITMSVSFDDSNLLTKASLLYIINNEATTSAITMTLNSYAYSRWATDADVVAALANHPNISLAQ